MTGQEIRPAARRRPRPRLRSLMVVMIPAAAWLGAVARHAHVQARAARSVIAAGGSVGFDNDPPPPSRFLAPARSTAPAPKPPWHVRLLGADHFRSVVSARLDGASNPELVPAALSALADCSRLESLDLNAIALDDAQLRSVGRMTGLRNLYLRRVDFTRASIAPLANLTKLVRLDVTNSLIDDGQLAAVGGLTQLESLRFGWMNGGGVGDAGVAHLAAMVHLKEAELNENPRITDASCAVLARLTGLTRLDLDGTRVGDAGAERLGTLGDLREIRLQRSRITDVGLRCLKPLKKLFVLRVDECPVSRAGVDELSSANPGLRFLFTSLR